MYRAAVTKLSIAAVLTFFMCGTLFVWGKFRCHSLLLYVLACLSLSEFVAICVELVMIKFSEKGSKQSTFGYVRAGLVGTTINHIFLFGQCFNAIIESVQNLTKSALTEQAGCHDTKNTTNVTALFNSSDTTTLAKAVEEQHCHSFGLECETSTALYLAVAALMCQCVTLFLYHFHDIKRDTILRSVCMECQPMTRTQTLPRRQSFVVNIFNMGCVADPNNLGKDLHPAAGVKHTRKGCKSETSVLHKPCEITKNEDGTRADLTPVQSPPTSGGHRTEFFGGLRWTWMKTLLLDVSASFLAAILAIIFFVILYMKDGKWPEIQYIEPGGATIIVLMVIATKAVLFKNVTMILLQTAPPCIRPEELAERLIEEVEEVIQVHELHIWQLTGVRLVGTVHVMTLNDKTFLASVGRIKAFFHNEGIHSVTIQPEFIESAEKSLTANIYCLLDCPEECKDNRCCGQDDLKEKARFNTNMNNQELPADVFEGIMDEVFDVDGNTTEA